jgi:hypothetical protein
VLYVNGGRLNPLSGLADGTGDELSSGSLFGGGLTLMLGRNVALRAYVSRVSTDYKGPTLAVEDSSVTRVSYGGDLMIGWPMELGIAPYLFGGLGAAAIDPADNALGSFTKLLGRVGAGFNYLLEGSALTPFLEAGVHFYSFDRFGFDKTQVDVSATVGLALAIPF